MHEPAKLVQDLLLQAVEIEDPEKQAAFLATACGGNAELRRELDELLTAHKAANQFFAGAAGEPAIGVKAPTSGKVLLEKAGDRIERYKLLQKVGEGGCGVVYMAEQEEPVRRQVALKVIKLGMDTKSVVARFEAERQALALMDHPNIARVLDAGATETGRSFFVMELVRGIKITDYCDQNELSTKRRLELLIQVCQAIQHAHQKGIIHRDLKPSNILVTVNDDVPVPKVIDFGIAKATGGRLTDQTLFTAFEQFMGTPDYMSPEQAAMTSLDIDTRSDIYSLGVLLYELLTGKTPFDTKALLASGLDEVRRVIREKEPVRPSTRVSTMLEAERTTTAKRRQTQAPKLISLLRGDLDWIVMKCLEKDRKRRFETASGLARDIQRHLNNEPVVARPPSRLYEFQKTVRRHRVGFAAAATVGLALCSGLAALAYGLHRANAERDLQRHVSYASDLNLCSQCWLWSDYSTCRQLLKANIPAPGERDLRGFEWWYFWRLCRGDEVFSLGPIAGTFTALAFLPGERLIAGAAQVRSPVPGSISTNADGLFVWDWRSRRLLTRVPTWGISDLSVSPDGSRIAFTCWDDTIRILDGTTYSTLTNCSCSSQVVGVAFSPDGNYLAARGEHCLYLFNVASHAPAEVLPAFENHEEKPAFSPDGQLVVFMQPDARLGLWNLREHHLVSSLSNAAQARLVGPQGLKPVESVTGRHAFSPDGKLLASGDCFGRVMVHNLETTAIRLAWAHFGYFALVAVSPDGKTLASASWDGLLRLADPITGVEFATYQGHESAIQSVTFAPAGDFVLTGGRDGYVRVWDARPQAPSPVPIAETGMQFNPSALVAQQTNLNFNTEGKPSFSPNGRLLSVPWDPRPSTPSQRDTVPQCYAGTEHAVSRGAKFLVFRDTNALYHIKDLETGAEIDHYTPFEGEVVGAISPNGRLVAASFDDGRILLREPRRTNARPFPLGHTNRVTVMEFSSDGNLLATASRDGWLKVWKVGDLGLIAQAAMPGSTHIEGPKALAFSRNGTLVACGENSDRRVVLLELTPPSPTRYVTMPFTGWTTRALAFSPDGRTLAASGYSDRAALYDLRSGRQVALLGNDSFTGFERAEFTPDGRRLALAATGKMVSLTLWDLESKRSVLNIYVSGDSQIDQMRISPSGERIALTLTDGSCRIYSAPHED